MVSVLNRLKNKELLAVPGQESVVLAAEVEMLGNLNCEVNVLELPCLSCARQVIRVVHFCTVITCHCNEPLEKLVDPPNQYTPATSSKRPTIKMERRSNVFSPFASPKLMANALRRRRVKSSTWFAIVHRRRRGRNRGC